MPIERISSARVGTTTPISPGSSNVPITPSRYNFKDHLKFPEQELKNGVAEDNQTSHEIVAMLSKLLVEILSRGCSIVRRGALKVSSNSQIEASFQPPLNSRQQPIMHLPLAGMSIDKIEAPSSYLNTLQRHMHEVVSQSMKEVAANCDNQQLLKLLVLTAHEYGHFMSYLNGFHDQQLKTGLSVMFEPGAGKQDSLSYAVFNEEVTAWRFAENKLKSYQFDYWLIFNKVRTNSLQAYFQQLKLKNASVSTYCKLSMIGIDLKEISADED